MIKNMVDIIGVTERIGYRTKYCKNYFKFGTFMYMRMNTCESLKRNNDRYHLYYEYNREQHHLTNNSYECVNCRRTNYNDRFDNSMGYMINENGSIFIARCRSDLGCYCDSWSKCYICELCEYGLYCEKKEMRRHTTIIKEKEHRQKKHT